MASDPTTVIQKVLIASQLSPFVHVDAAPKLTPRAAVPSPSITNWGCGGDRCGKRVLSPLPQGRVGGTQIPTHPSGARLTTEAINASCSAVMPSAPLVLVLADP